MDSSDLLYNFPDIGHHVEYGTCFASLSLTHWEGSMCSSVGRVIDGVQWFTITANGDLGAVYD